MANEAERFARLGWIVTESGCWEWAGSRDRKGYGKFWAWSKLSGAHRVSFALHVGPIPDGMGVLHRCDNPPCINPEHLFLGRQSENMQDMLHKGRGGGTSRPGGRNGNAKFSDDEARKIRERYAAGGVLLRELASEYRVSVSAIGKITSGFGWKHLAGEDSNVQ